MKQCKFLTNFKLVSVFFTIIMTSCFFSTSRAELSAEKTVKVHHLLDQLAPSLGNDEVKRLKSLPPKKLKIELFKLLSSQSEQKTEPLYELGIGLLYSRFPDYPGSSNTYSIALPYPSVIFRGEILRAKRDEGVRGLFYEGKNWEIDLSFDGTFASKKTKGGARENMPRLSPLIEFGPKAIYYIKRRDTASRIKPQYQAALHLPLRSAIAIDFDHTQEQGIVLNPFISLNIYNVPGNEDMLLFSYGYKFASQKFHRYYYEVEPQYATELRNTYHANSGLVESSLAMALFKKLPYDLWLLSGFIHTNYRNSSNRNSPLLKEKSTHSIVIGLSWNFHQSEYQVPIR